MEDILSAPMRYEKKMVPKDFDKIKIENIDEDGVKRTHMLPTFNGDGSSLGDTEAFLYCLSFFERFVPILKIPVTTN